jgi:transcriptional regulator with XRE-family HTH domain
MELLEGAPPGIGLKLLRVQAGVRQYKVAQALGIAPTTLCEWENGRRPVPPRQAARVRAAIARLAPGGIGGGDGLPS